MSPLADWLSRRVWWLLLWFVRRPVVRRMQRASTDWHRDPAKRERARLSLARQERFALRHGRRILFWAFLIALYLVVLQLVYALLAPLAIVLRPSS